jgi:hypothetical protein
MALAISHNFGFFSCSTMRLHHLINYFHEHKKLPIVFDSSDCYEWYKHNDEDFDITFNYFKHYDGIPENIEYTRIINYKEWFQFKSYNQLDFEGIVPFIKKYFSPSDKILKIIKTMEEKYKLDYNNICVLFFRGNDKITEVELPSYDEYIYYGKYVLNLYPNVKFLIQSDETNFINTMANEFPNHIIFKDEIRHIQDNTTTVDKVFKKTNFQFSMNYLAITIIMSKCKYIICNTGNCSIWIMFYRENADNLIQFRACTFI